MTWTTPADLKAQVQKWWARGELLACLIDNDPLFPRRLTLKGPVSNEVADRFDELRAWVAELKDMQYCRIEMREFKHRLFGKNALPAEVWIDTLDEALAFIGKRREAGRFLSLVETTRANQPALLSWLKKRPLRALEFQNEWEPLLKIVAWLQTHPRPDIYLRQVDIVGIHSKFIEAHRGVLSEWLDLVLPPESIDFSVSGVSQFARRYGFRDKPMRIRFRILDPSCVVLPIGGEQDIAVDIDTFAKLDPKISQVFITENEINFLSFPQLPASMVIFGAGYGFDIFTYASWLLNCGIYYWGDIDTHGFAILSSARSHFQHIQSLLMDEQALLMHKKLWGNEESQHAANELPYLTDQEHSTYKNLKHHRWGKNVRLEQERIDWTYALKAIHQALGSNTSTAAHFGTTVPELIGPWRKQMIKKLF